MLSIIKHGRLKWKLNRRIQVDFKLYILINLFSLNVQFSVDWDTAGHRPLHNRLEDVVRFVREPGDRDVSRRAWFGGSWRPLSARRPSPTGYRWRQRSAGDRQVRPYGKPFYYLILTRIHDLYISRISWYREFEFRICTYQEFEFLIYTYPKFEFIDIKNWIRDMYIGHITNSGLNSKTASRTPRYTSY